MAVRIVFPQIWAKSSLNNHIGHLSLPSDITHRSISGNRPPAMAVMPDVCHGYIYKHAEQTGNVVPDIRGYNANGILPDWLNLVPKLLMVGSKSVLSLDDRTFVVTVTTTGSWITEAAWSNSFTWEQAAAHCVLLTHLSSHIWSFFTRHPALLFTQTDSFSTKNKWPLLAMCNSEKILICSLFSHQLGSAAVTFLSIIKDDAQTPVSFPGCTEIHWWHRNSILNITYKMERHVVSILLFHYSGDGVSFPADSRLIGLLHSLSSPVLWLFFSTHSHLPPASLQVECEIHLFQGRNQSALCPMTDHFVCSFRQFLLSLIGIIQRYKSDG